MDKSPLLNIDSIPEIKDRNSCKACFVSSKRPASYSSRIVSSSQFPLPFLFHVEHLPQPLIHRSFSLKQFLLHLLKFHSHRPLAQWPFSPPSQSLHPHPFLKTPD